MGASRSLVRSVAAVVAALLLLGACGGDDSEPSAADDGGGGGGEEASGSSDEESSGDDGSSDDGSSGEVDGTDLADLIGVDAAYNQGQAHVEVSGDIDVSMDLDIGGGFTENGLASLSFSNSSGDVLGLVLDPNGGTSGVSVSSADFGTGGRIPGECSVDLSESSETAIAGTFECDDVIGVEGSSLDDVTVDVSGTFSLSA